jgi:Zn-dependent metalloprotease
VEHPAKHNNAGFMGSYMLIGDVDVDSLRSFAGNPDVIAHEWAHGITYSEANLAYEKESGALSEAFSNMMAAYFNYDWLGQHNDDCWLIGKNHWINNPSKVVNNMKEPHLTGQPDTYLNDNLWRNLNNCIPDTTPANDHCYVHTNCGVPNKMFYLLSNGGTHNGIVVQGIGMQNAFNVMYTANRQRLWPSNSTFWNARDGSIRSALQIDTTSHTARNVADAWNAVNLCDTCNYVPGDVNGNGEARGSDITLLVAFLKRLAPPPDSCHIPYQINGQDWFYVAADYNGDCIVSGADVIWGVAYYKGFKPEIRHCPHFSPSLP